MSISKTHLEVRRTDEPLLCGLSSALEEELRLWSGVRTSDIIVRRRSSRCRLTQQCISKGSCTCSNSRCMPSKQPQFKFFELRDKLEPFNSEDELSSSMHLQPLTSTGSRDACSRCPILRSDTPATGCKSSRERRAGTIR